MGKIPKPRASFGINGVKQTSVPPEHWKMTSPSDSQHTAETTTQRAPTHIAEHRERIEHQRALIARLESDGHTGAIVLQARGLLKTMLELLEQMLAEQRNAEARAAQIEPLDEKSLDDVSRDCPL